MLLQDHRNRPWVVLADFLTNNQQIKLSGERGWILHQCLLSKDQVASIIKSWFVDEVAFSAISMLNVNAEKDEDVTSCNGTISESPQGFPKEIAVTDKDVALGSDIILETPQNSVEKDIKSMKSIAKDTNNKKEPNLLLKVHQKGTAKITDEDVGPRRGAIVKPSSGVYVTTEKRQPSLILSRHDKENVEIPDVDLDISDDEHPLDPTGRDELYTKHLNKKRCVYPRCNIVISRSAAECAELKTALDSVNFGGNNSDRIVFQYFSDEHAIKPSIDTKATTTTLLVMLMTLDVFLCIRPKLDSVGIVIMNTTVEDVVTYERIKSVLLKTQPKWIEFVQNCLFEVSHFFVKSINEVVIISEFYFFFPLLELEFLFQLYHKRSVGRANLVHARS